MRSHVGFGKDGGAGGGGYRGGGMREKRFKRGCGDLVAKHGTSPHPTLPAPLPVPPAAG